jgi:DNA helicase-2/ATP-dependent DNA helicase PcrA
VDKYDEDADAVVMMTIHSAKGLEFPIVFLPGMEDGIFPGMQNIMAGPDDMEEERRLAYVAITRAKDQLYISHAKLRMLYGRTQCNPVSRFVGEIPDELIYEDIPRNPYYYAPQQTQQKVKVYYSEPAQKSTTGFDPYNFVGTKATQKTVQKGNLSLKEGDRVFHITFGEGEIMSARSMGGDVLYEVVFDKVGTKKLMGTYAKLKKLD